jgi:hypothetical protein
LIDSEALSDREQTLESDEQDTHQVALDAQAQSSSNRQRLNGTSHDENRAPVATDRGVPLNRQAVSSDSLTENRTPLPGVDLKGRTFESAPRREAEAVLNRFFETWQDSAANEPESVRKKAGFKSEIPPTIHGQRVVDFSSLNIYLDDAHPQEADASAPDARTQKSTSSSTVPKRNYDYKLRACLDILKRQQDVVNSKLQRIQEKK